jgi:uncharacterized protein YrrD
VVSAVSGRKLGTVGDLLLDDSGGLTGLIIRHGMLHAEEVLPVDAVQSLGRDAVVSSSDELIGAKQWQERDHPGGAKPI